MLPSQIVAFIQTFYGYGNPEGQYWLIGMEEGGGGSKKYFREIGQEIGGLSMIL